MSKKKSSFLKSTKQKRLQVPSRINMSNAKVKVVVKNHQSMNIWKTLDHIYVI